MTLMLLCCMTLAAGATLPNNLQTTASETRKQMYQLAGCVTDAETGRPIDYASVLLNESGQWAITDKKGEFSIKNAPAGHLTITVQCLGYQKRTLNIQLQRNVTDMKLKLNPENLKIKGVTVTVRRKQDEATTSYTISRQTLDQQQIMNLSELQTLLPGGKTVNPSLMNDDRMALRSGSQEKGNASFGTAIEVDGMRLSNNASMEETTGASTRTLSTSNIESVEIVTGIPSVEYGDLSNGIVKVNTRKGKSPFIVEGRINQHTHQIALNKGFELGKQCGVLNVSAEHARSFSDPVSPYTAYQRNVVSLHYMNVFMRESMPLTLNAGLTANLGGYNSEADPDRNMDEYQKERDHALRGTLDLQWLLNKPWMTNLRVSGSIGYSDRKRETYQNTSTASTLPYLHTREEGYFMAEDYDRNPNAPIILSPTGYWHTRGFVDSKPLTWAVKLKANLTRRLGSVTNNLLVGIDYSGNKNNGRGSYYEDMRYAPTWREYRYDQLPAMHNMAVFAEEKMVIPTAKHSTLEFTIGLREDLTFIRNSEYGTVGSLSPRTNMRYVFWKHQYNRWVSNLELHAGWGKSVKLPSFQVLFPSPSYTDLLAFASTSDATNKTYRAYHTMPTTAQYNPELRWQYTHQVDVGLEAVVAGHRISVSAFYHRTNHSYMSKKTYMPFAYQFTPVDSLNRAMALLGLSQTDEARFSIDRQSGLVTMNTDGSEPLRIGNYTRRTYAVGSTYVNSYQPIHRYGLEWIIDFAQIKPLLTTIRLDGNYSCYKGTDEQLFADIPSGTSSTMSNKELYQYVGYYRGSNIVNAGNTANATSIANGALSRQLNLNATFTTHIPKIRMILSLRIESTLYSYRRSLSMLNGQWRGYVVEDGNGYTGTPYDGSIVDKNVVVYPEYYSTWDNPDQLIPFAERFLWAKDNDPTLYNDLSKLVVRSNFPYILHPNKLSAYYSANLSVTKELGDHVSVSFYANNFFRNMHQVHSSQTDLYTSLFSSSYIPNFYYGLSLRLKL